MANEGEFPKSDGDILYGTDVNFLVGLGSSTTIGTTAEFTYPKTDGDLLYPTELNYISKTKPATSGIAIISGATWCWDNTSGLAVTDEDPTTKWAGSLIGPVSTKGEITINLPYAGYYDRLYYQFKMSVEGGATDDFRIYASGATFKTQLVVHSTGGPNQSVGGSLWTGINSIFGKTEKIVVDTTLTDDGSLSLTLNQVAVF